MFNGHKKVMIIENHEIFYIYVLILRLCRITGSQIINLDIQYMV